MHQSIPTVTPTVTTPSQQPLGICQTWGWGFLSYACPKGGLGVGDNLRYQYCTKRDYWVIHRQSNEGGIHRKRGTIECLRL